MKYKCLECGETNECPNNASGIGICPKCTPAFTKKYGKGNHTFITIETLKEEVTLCKST